MARKETTPPPPENVIELEQAIELDGTTYGPGSVTVANRSIRRALLRVQQNDKEEKDARGLEPTQNAEPTA